MKNPHFAKIPVSPSKVRNALDELDIRPSKALGQNFLADANVLAVMLDIIGTKHDDEILEVGPGLGVLTEPMARVAHRVVAVEKDRRLFAWLKEHLGEFPNCELIRDDMLRVDYEALRRRGIKKVVSNLPYSVGSAILVNLLKPARPPVEMILTMQLEQAKRVVALPGDPGFGLLSVWSGFRHDARILKVISPKCFYPAPDVKSAVIKLTIRLEPVPGSAERQMFFGLTKFAFSQRRKQLKTLFRRPPAALGFSGEQVLDVLQVAGIDSAARPETLSVSDWKNVAKRIVPPPQNLWVVNKRADL